jgi:iron-sulfur cluster repair protein YtfE (RIC family)
MSYRLYREHKFVTFTLFQLEQLIAKTDFCSDAQVETVLRGLNDLTNMMIGHAEHEEAAIHPLLANKGSTSHHIVEADHKEHEETLQMLIVEASVVGDIPDPIECTETAYHFYLNYRLFVSEVLQHLYYEETQLLPELQRLYSAEELRNIEAPTYNEMAPEHMVDMINVLFPHMNVDDKQSFLNDIQKLEPEKFQVVWEAIAPQFNDFERKALRD